VNLVAKFLARYAARNVPQYILGALMLFATNWVLVRIPAVIGETLNVLQAHGATALQDSRDLAIELAVLGAIVIGVRTLSRVLFFNPGREIEYRLCVDLFGHLLTLQRPYFARHKVGELVSIASNDATSVRVLVGFAGLQVFNVVVAIPLHIYQMWVTDWVLTLWCLAPVIFGAAYMRWTVKRFFGMIRKSMQLLARLSDRVLESYTGIGTIRSHAAEHSAMQRFEERNDEYLQLHLRIASIRAFGMPALGFSGLVGTGVVLWVGGNRVLAGEMQVGGLATFTTLLISLVMILTGLAWVLAAVSRGLVSLGRVESVLATPPEVPEPKRELELTRSPRLEIRDLSFTYPDGEEPALEGISAVVEPGKTLGIFGKTGSGKTTLISLLARIQTPDPATVLIDGMDIVDLPLAKVREAMAVVPQSPFLFSTTLRQNIALDAANPFRAAREAPAADDPRLDHVISEACLADDLSQLPDGLETVVGERGVMLSGGQRQRAALARALYRNRPILLLDDILSAVDQGTETRMVQAIRNLRDDVEGSLPPTTVIVSHRTSVLEHADEILVLDGGRVVERGTHEDLVALGGEYAETHQHQGTDA
jgi:ATP-binding cassette subfamily B protein